MNQEQYEALVTRLEEEAERNPSLYRVKLGSMAVLGYAYVAAMIALLIGVVVLLGLVLVRGRAGALAAKLGIIIVPLIWAVVRAMFVRLQPPTGREVTREIAPKLIGFVDNVRRTAGAPPAHKVLITDNFNAAVVQHPRLGIFGWPRNYLVLGLPLMQALALEEFRAVLAHEFGHLSGAHGKFGAWIYRLRLGWARLAGALEHSDHWGKFLFVPFFNWYAPAFAAYSFVQARRQEYEADRVAAAAASPAAAGAALVRVEVQAQFLEREYWKGIFREADSIARPVAQPFTAMRTAFAQTHSDAANGSLEAALKRRTASNDTHPSLSDRLRALGVEPRLPVAVSISAAETLLGPLTAKVAAEFDDQWRQSVADWWQRRHEYAAQSRSKLAELDAAAAAGELSVGDAYRRAELTEELVDEASAFEQLEALESRAAEHAPTQFALGRLKLAREDESGLAHLKNASRLDASAVQGACALIVDYLHRHGRNEEARPYIDELIHAGERDEAARRERSIVSPSDKFLPHGLPADAVQALVAQLQRHRELRSAWLVRKQTRHYQHLPMYILGVRRASRWWRWESEASNQRLVSELSQQVEFPGETLIVSVDGSNKNFRGRFKKIAHSAVYVRR